MGKTIFEKFVKRSYYRQKHLEAPLLDERIKYIQFYSGKGRALNTLHGVANYLLRIVEFLHLNSRRIIKLDEIEEAANTWASYEYNHPQKRGKFSKASKAHFIRYATDWLKRLGWLEPLPEEKIPFFNHIIEKRHAIRKHIKAPFLKERILYLQKWEDDGAAPGTLRAIAHYMLGVINFLKLDKKDGITPKEIQKAAEKWANRTTGHVFMKRGYSIIAERRFKSVATNWLNMMGKLKHPKVKADPHAEFITQYIDYMRKERGLSERTIDSRVCILKNFFRSIESKVSLQQLTPLNIDDVLKKKHLEGRCRRTIQTYASVLRTFFTYAEGRKWCRSGLALSIRLSRVYRHEQLPQGPSWDDVKELLTTTEGDHPTNIRDRAILLLLSVYGLRCGEVTHLRLEDLDWENELLFIRRSKTFKSQKFPLTQTVGNAILMYLKKVRPNGCPCREVFICRRAPYRPLSSAAIFRIVSSRLKPLELGLKHHGPHALRHACATHLINQGISLKEISDHLGHCSLESSRVYAKVDLSHLRKVADFEIGDLL